MPLFAKDGTVVREIKRLYARDGNTVRTVRKLFSTSGGVVREIFSAATTWLISGVAQVFAAGNKEVIDFGVREDFDAGGVQPQIDFGFSRGDDVEPNFTPGGAFQEVDLGFNSDFNGGGDSSITEATFIDYQFPTTLAAPTFTNVVGISFGPEWGDLDDAQDTLVPNEGGTRTLNTWTATLEFMVRVINENSAKGQFATRGWEASLEGTDTVRVTARDNMDSGSFVSGDNRFQLGIARSGLQFGPALGAGYVVTVTSNAFTQTLTAVYIRDRSVFWFAGDETLSGSLAVRGLSPAATFEISNSGESIPGITGTFAFDTNATAARTTIRSALENDTDFAADWAHLSDVAVPAVPGIWDMTIDSIPTLTTNDTQVQAYLPINGLSSLVIFAVSTTDTIEDVVDTIIATSPNNSISPLTVTKVGTDTIRVTNPNGFSIARNAAIGGALGQPACGFNAYGITGVSTGSIGITLTDGNDPSVTFSATEDLTDGNSLFMFYNRDIPDGVTRVSGADPQTVARYRALTGDVKSDFTFDITADAVDADNTDPYNVISTAYQAPATFSISSDDFTTITGTFDIDTVGGLQAPLDARNTVRTALLASTEFTALFPTNSTGSGAQGDNISVTEVRFFGDTPAPVGAITFTITGDGVDGYFGTEVIDGALPAAFSISNTADSIPAITGSYTMDADNDQARTDFKTALAADAEFIAQWEFVDDRTEMINGFNHTIARYQTVTNRAANDFTFTNTENGGSNTTAAYRTVTQGVADTPATVITVTDPDATITVTTATGTSADEIGALIAALDAEIFYDSATNILEAGPDTTITVANGGTMTIVEQ